MNNIDVSQVTDEGQLDLINFKNFTMFEDKTFFENIDINLEKLIFDVGLDKNVLSSYISSKKPYQEFLAKYEERYKTGVVKKDSSVVNTAYDYAIMFLTPAYIMYGDDIVCADEETNGAYVFSELYDRFSPEDLPYGNLEGFVGYYKSKNQRVELKRK